MVKLFYNMKFKINIKNVQITYKTKIKINDTRRSYQKCPRHHHHHDGNPQVVAEEMEVELKNH